jgi:hypothetical protein
VTVDSLFEALRRKFLDERRYVDSLSYDRHYGWPSQYKSDATAPITDVWEKVTVERFDVIR